jgi:hypothetical protein
MVKTDYSEEDRRIVEAAWSYPGIPTPQSLSRDTRGPLPYSAGRIRGRVKDNPEVKAAIENAGVAYVNTCNIQTFVTGLKSPKWWRASEPVVRAMENRIDVDIVRALISYPGFPDPHDLIEGESALPYTRSLVYTRFNDSQFLRPALVKHGLEYFSNCSSEELAANLLSALPVEVHLGINRRLDREIFSAMRESPNRILSPLSLIKSGGGPLIYSEFIVRARFKARFWLQKAREIVAVRFIRTCSSEVFVETLPSLQKCPIREIKSEIEKRIVAHILEEIKHFKGVPDYKNLSKENGGPLPYVPATLYSYIHSNESLRDAIESKTAASAGTGSKVEPDSHPPNPLIAHADALQKGPASFGPGHRTPSPWSNPREPSISRIVQRLRQS